VRLIRTRWSITILIKEKLLALIFITGKFIQTKPSPFLKGACTLTTTLTTVPTPLFTASFAPILAIPIECYLGKINPQTGVATRVSQQPLPYSSYTINGSSTIDPINGVYYFSVLLPQGGYAVAGISVTTGLVVFEQLITPQGAASNALYFDLLRHPGDCFEATPTRVNPNNSAGLANNGKYALKVAPNPFEQQFSVTATEQILAITLRDAQGKVVLQQVANSNKVGVETAHLQKWCLLFGSPDNERSRTCEGGEVMSEGYLNWFIQ